MQIRQVKKEDMDKLLGMALQAKELGLFEDETPVSMEGLEVLVENNTVYIGEHGFFIAHYLTNTTMQVHPYWQGAGAVDAFELFLNEISKVCLTVAGFVPMKNQRAMRFFRKCGFISTGILNDSVIMNNVLDSQVIMQRRL